MAGSYLLVSPCRDEAEFMRRTLESVAAQSVPPGLWVVVDDGSTDATPAILEEYSRRLPYLRVVRREDRGRRSVGPGVIEAFEAGLQSVGAQRFDYLCKLDLDLELPPGYFEGLMRRMEDDPRLGTCSGKPWVPHPDGGLVREVCGDEMSVGMTKFYRTSCFEQIGGFVPEVMWDGIDCHRCRMLGWSAASYEDPDLRFLHLRPMGSSQDGILVGRWRHGTGQWFMGTGLLYMTASALFRMGQPPRLLGGVAMWLGYVASMLSAKRRYEDGAFRRFLRRYQLRCLLIGKRRATAEIETAGVGGRRASAP
ncbi:MAG: glycosyltransferase family 2 protein [Planctomycetota bacterium]|jgi:glycosyltransferase involved in cell wall biosynthesis